MKTRGFILSFLLVAMYAPGALAGEAPDRHAALDRMGELNGVALACRYDDRMREIKQALIDTLPKERALGAQFEEGTNASFMEFVRSGRPCPSPARFETEVKIAIEQLKQAYGDTHP